MKIKQFHRHNSVFNCSKGDQKRPENEKEKNQLYHSSKIIEIH